MRHKNLKRAVILSLIIFGFHPVGYAAVNISGNDSDGNITIGADREYGTVDGYRQEADGNAIDIIKDNLCEKWGKCRSSKWNGLHS